MEFYKDGKLVNQGFTIGDINYPRPTQATVDFNRNLGVLPVKELPAINHTTQKIIVVETPYEEDGFWVVREVIDLTDNEKMDIIRSKRNHLLEETDWTGLSDVTMSNEMVVYRQALRDLPLTIDISTPLYPTKPE